jgi:DNA-directed RNA polymerase specialized sigma24 family protein
VAAQNLPQLYRFCFLMTGEASKAQDIFQDTLREAAFLVANREPPADRYWFFREARWRCLDVVAQGVQPEHAGERVDRTFTKAPEQIEQLDLNNWRSGFLLHRSHNAALSPSITWMSLTIAK